MYLVNQSPKHLLYFDYMYYRYYPKYAVSNKWKELNYNISVDIAINEKGLILDSLGDEHNEK